MSETGLAEHFETLDQQHIAAGAGMWAFLMTEVMFFGAMFTAYTVYRIWYPQGFAEGSKHLFMWIGATNSAILFGSSITTTFAVRAAHHAKQRQLVIFLASSIILGCIFMGLKAMEYHFDMVEHTLPGPRFDASTFIHPRQAQLFLAFYWIFTGLHAIHLTIGIGVMTGLLIYAARGLFHEDNCNVVEMAGLYWHFVDIVWIFLFPLLYLVR